MRVKFDCVGWIVRSLQHMEEEIHATGKFYRVAGRIKRG